MEEIKKVAGIRVQDLEPYKPFPYRVYFGRHPNSGLSWQASRQSGTPNLLASAAMLYSHLIWGLHWDLWLASLLSRTCQMYFDGGVRATCPAHLSLRDLITLGINARRWLPNEPMDLVIWTHAHPACNWILLGPRIQCKTLFPNTNNFFWARMVRFQVSQS